METQEPTLQAADAQDAAAEAADYWHSLIDEIEAGKFLGLSPRTMQLHRQRGGGAPYVRISARCIRYRRADLRDWSADRIRTSTSDQGGDA